MQKAYLSQLPSFRNYCSGVRCSGYEETPPMTMQVGMIGTDGIVLAGDTWCSRSPRNPGFAARMGYHASKIKISHERGIAVAVSGDMDRGNEVASRVISEVSESDVSARESSILAISDSVFRNLP